MRPEDILLPTPAGLCCKLGGFHIDPTRPVDKAVITHGHSDHARPGHSSVLATQETLDLMALRYGGNFAGTTQAARYGESLTIGGATVTFRPAGHVLGSGQVAVAMHEAVIFARHAPVGGEQAVGLHRADLAAALGRPDLLALMMDAGEDFLLCGLLDRLGVGRGAHRAEAGRAQDQDEGGALEVHDVRFLGSCRLRAGLRANAKPAQTAHRALNRF